MEVGIIYVATNRLNGKCYVGQTWQSFRRRQKGHLNGARKGSRTVFGAAIRKYGPESFDWEILDEGTTQHALDYLECLWITEFNSIAPNGYNLRDGGNNGRLSEVLKQRLREATTLQFATEESRRLHGVICRGHHMPQEAKDKIRQFRTGRKLSDETKAKIAAKATGRGHTDETKKKLSEAAKNQTNRVPPPLATGLKRSEETKRKMSEAIKRHYEKLRASA